MAANRKPPPNVTLVRQSTSDHGTHGVLLIDGAPFCYTIEPPWRNNQPDISCIPPGVYRCVWHRSPKYGWVYLITGVDGRSYILIHPGNYGGDRLKGLKSDTHGCILLGTKRGWLRGQRVVLASRVAVKRFFQKLNKASFHLTIIGETS